MGGKWASVRKGEGCERGERGENEEINHTRECKIRKKCNSKTCKFVFSSLHVYHCLHMYTYIHTQHTRTHTLTYHIHTNTCTHKYAHVHTQTHTPPTQMKTCPETQHQPKENWNVTIKSSVFEDVHKRT